MKNKAVVILVVVVLVGLVLVLSACIANNPVKRVLTPDIRLRLGENYSYFVSNRGAWDEVLLLVPDETSDNEDLLTIEQIRTQLATRGRPTVLVLCSKFAAAKILRYDWWCKPFVLTEGAKEFPKQ